MIIEYHHKYDEEIKDLLVELQEHIVKIDKEKYNIITQEYREKYFIKTMAEIGKYQGKMLLCLNDNKVVGLVVGMVNNDDISSYNFKAPKRGKITELIVSKNCRAMGFGKELLTAMEKHLKSLNCKDIMLDVFAYNDSAIKFYEKNGYKTRLVEMTKTNI